MTNINNMYETLITYGVATEEELQFVTDIFGWNEQSLLNLLRARTGYRNFEQFLDEYSKEEQDDFLSWVCN